nr:MAG TPA: hypothetical protein [Caudoviricetes sp.]
MKKIPSSVPTSYPTLHNKFKKTPKKEVCRTTDLSKIDF